MPYPPSFQGLYALGKVDGVQDFDPVGLIDDPAAPVPHRLSVLVQLRRAVQEHFSRFLQKLPFGIGDDIGAVHLHDGRFDKEPRLAAAGAADDEDVFISRILWLLWAAGHGEAFCPGQGDVPIGNRVYVGRDIRRRAP